MMNPLVNKTQFACVTGEMIITDIVPGRVGIEKARALYYFKSKGIESIFVSNMQHRHKRAALVTFDNAEQAQTICDMANIHFNEDFQVKQIDINAGTQGK